MVKSTEIVCHFYKNCKHRPKWGVRTTTMHLPPANLELLRRDVTQHINSDVTRASLPARKRRILGITHELRHFEQS
jgi:hypothetical protein